MNEYRISIGRDSRNDIHVDERWDTVSNRHGEIVYENGMLTFIDHSSNGTVINGQKIQNTSVGIYRGDDILLANVYPLEWEVIERFFPLQQRPTVTRNVRGEGGQSVGRKTVNKSAYEAQQKGRKTEQFENRNRHDSIGGFPANNDANFGQANQYSQSEIDSELERWNWGGFFCNWLWGVFNGIYWPLFIILIAGVPYLGQVATLCLSVYLGLNGSKMAWRSGKYTDFAKFRQIQKNWAIGGAVWFIISVICNIYWLIYVLSLI